MAALFTIAKLWNQPRCSSTNKWIKKIIYIMEYYSTTKKNEMLFEGKWMELELIRFSGITQPEKDKYLIFSLIYGI
jgi:hypothetical protein